MQRRHLPGDQNNYCYKLVQGFRVTCLFTGQYNTKGYDMITDVIQLLAGWIEVSILPQSLVWLLGFGGNHSLLFFVQYFRHHIKTRQIHYYYSGDLKSEHVWILNGPELSDRPL